MIKRLLGYLFFSLVSLCCISQKLAVTNLRCEYRQNPLGVDAAKPRLSWELNSNQRNILQTAYRVLVADDPSLLEKNIGNIWDSKKKISKTSIQVEYNGKTLAISEKIFLESNGMG